MSYIGLLNSTCDVENPTLTTDGMGGHTTAWAVLHNDLACRMFDVSAKEQAIYGREGVVVTHRFYIEYQNDITEDCRILHNAIYYNIQGVRDMAAEQRCMVLETERVK